MNRYASVKLPAVEKRGIDRNAGGGGSFALARLGGRRDRARLLCGFALLFRRRALVLRAACAAVGPGRFALWGHFLFSYSSLSLTFTLTLSRSLTHTKVSETPRSSPREESRERAG